MLWAILLWSNPVNEKGFLVWDEGTVDCGFDYAKGLAVFLLVVEEFLFVWKMYMYLKYSLHIFACVAELLLRL